MDKLYVGAAREIITPKIGCQLYGYYTDLFSNAVNDDLRVTAFAFKHKGRTAMLISAEVCIVSCALYEQLKEKITEQTGVETVFLSVTHTHSGPNTAGAHGWGDIDQEYCDTIFVPRILEAAKEACANMKPATMGIGTTDSYVGINRRETNKTGKADLGQNPWGCFDKTMTVITFKDEEGELIANMIHYGCHCTAAGANKEITRDWAGVMCDILERESGVITAYFNGAEGDVGPRLTNGYTTGRTNIAYAMEHGAVAGADAVRAFRQIKRFDDADLAVASDVIRLPYATKIPLEEAKKQLSEMCEWDDSRWGQQRKYLKDVIYAYENNLPEKEYFELPQTVLRLGPVVFVPFPYEVFSEITLRLQNESKYQYTVCLGLTNGNHGYFPSENEFFRGGYEVEMFNTKEPQILKTDADSHIVQENLRIMDLLD